MGKKQDERVRGNGDGRNGTDERIILQDPSAVGVTLVRTAAAVLRAEGVLVRLTPEWVDAHVRPDRRRASGRGT